MARASLLSILLILLVLWIVALAQIARSKAAGATIAVLVCPKRVLESAVPTRISKSALGEDQRKSSVTGVRVDRAHHLLI